MVNNFSLPELAGFISTILFVISNLPMLFKAFKTRNLKSYSLLHIGMANAGNTLYWLYVFSFPLGSLWLLHAFNTAVALLMLVGYLRYSLNIKLSYVQKKQIRD